MKTTSRSFFLFALILTIAACSGGAGPSVSTATPLPLPTKLVLTSPTPKATDTPAATNTPAATDTPPPSATSATTGKFGPITFAVGVLNDEVPVDPLTTYPNGVTIVYAFWQGIGVKDGQPWRSEWLLNGDVQKDIGKESKWDSKTAGANQIWWITLFNKDAIRAGEWQLNLYLGDQLAQSNKFTVEPNPLGQPDFGPITFAPEQKDDKPVNPIQTNDPTFPAGTKAVYAFFSGINVPKGTKWSSQWFHNGQATTDPKEHTWDFGPNEEDWINLTNTDDSPLEPGTYELKLTIGSRLVDIGTFIIPASGTNNAPTPAPTTAAEGFGPISFAAGVLKDTTAAKEDKPLDATATYPSGVTLVYAFWNGPDVKAGTAWRSEWLHDGQVQSKLGSDNKWDPETAGPKGVWWITLYNQSGIATGEWQLNLYLENKRVQSAKFTVEPNPSGQPDFGPITFASDQKNNEPVNPVKVSDPTFPAGTKTVYAFFDAINVPKGTQWSRQWFYNGKSAFDPKSSNWDADPNEKNWWVSCTNACFGGAEDSPLQPGTYEFKLMIGNRVVNLGTFIIPK